MPELSLYEFWSIVLLGQKSRQENGNWYIVADYLEMLQDDTAGHSFEDNETILLPDLEFSTTT